MCKFGILILGDGLCQAARQFWKKFVDITRKEHFGFTVGPADLCMLFKANEIMICIIIMYVDDMLIIGKKEQIQEFVTKYKRNFQLRSNTTWQTIWVMSFI